MSAARTSSERPGLPGDGRPGARRALVVIRSDFAYEAHALRAARKLHELGLETTVLATLGTDASRKPEERRDAIRVVRIGPSSALVRRLYGALRGRVADSAAAAEASGAADEGRPAATGPTPAGPVPRLPRRATRWAGRAVLWRLARWVTAADFNARGIALALRERPALVHCNDYNTMWIGVAARLAAGSGVVYDSREIWADRNLRPEPRWWLLAWETLFVRLAHQVIVTSPGHGEVLARRYRIRKPVLVRNVHERGDGGAAATPQPRDDRRPTVIYSGGLLRHRGLEQAIRALALLNGAALRLLGPVSPAYRAELERLAHDAGVEDRVEFAPPVPPSDVVRALADADAGLVLFQPNCLSHRLVLPNKLFEYVHAGLPVVGSDLPMIARFVSEHGVGATVEPTDVHAIADALRHVLEPRRHEELRAAARRAAETVTWEREGEVLADVYRDVLARSRTAAEG